MNEEVTKPKILTILEDDIAFYEKAIKEVAEEILKNGISKFPIFIAHQHEVNLGEMILDKNDFERKFSINASILEDLVEKKVIESSKINEFKGIYKDPRQFICVFLVTEKTGNFIFLPYKSKTE